MAVSASLKVGLPAVEIEDVEWLHADVIHHVLHEDWAIEVSKIGFCVGQGVLPFARAHWTRAIQALNAGLALDTLS